MDKGSSSIWGKEKRAGDISILCLFEELSCGGVSRIPLGRDLKGCLVQYFHNIFM